MHKKNTNINNKILLSEEGFLTIKGKENINCVEDCNPKKKGCGCWIKAFYFNAKIRAIWLNSQVEH